MEKKGSPFPFLHDLHTIFVDSDIDTHLAMVVSLHDTISDVKAKIMAEHALCFQDIGEISIRAVKVKRRGFFYNLADSMCVWNAFHGFQGSWFVYIDAVPVCPVKIPAVVANKVTHEHLEHHFNESAAISPFEPENKLGPDGRGIHNSNVMRKDHEAKNGLHEDCVEDCRGRSKKEFLAASSEGLPNKLPYEKNPIPLQIPSVEKHKKRKSKSSKSHEEAHLAVPSETLVPGSPQVRLDPHNSGKEADASIYVEKYFIGSDVNLLLPNDRDIRMAPDTTTLFGVTNQRENDRHSMETCMVAVSSVNIEPIEDRILQVDPEDRREKRVGLGQETNGDDMFKELEDIRVSSQAPSELPFKSYCCTDKLVSRSSKVLELKEPNDQQSREFDAAKCVTEMNPREDGEGITALAKKFSYEEQAAHGISKNFSGHEHQYLDRETDALANLKGANKNVSLTGVDFKVLHKSRRNKKRLRTGSSRACESTDINGDQEHFNSNDAAKIIKDADQKANGGNCVDTMIDISSSFKEAPTQGQVSHLNSGNPPIIMSHNLSQVSNLLVEQAPENKITLQPDFEVQARPCHSRKMSKSEPSKLGFEKSNEEVIGCGGRGVDPSKPANGTNEKIEQHCMDAKLTVSLSDEDSSKLAKMPQVNLLDSSSCNQRDLCDQSNAEVVIKEGDLTCILSLGALAGSTKHKRDRKKSKKEASKARGSSEMSEHIERCGHGHTAINLSDYFVSKRSENTHTADSPTELHKRHVIEGPPEEEDDAADAAAIKDSKPQNAEKAKSTNQSRKRNSLSKFESNSSLREEDEYQKLVKRLQAHFQLPKSNGMEGKQVKVTEDGEEETPSLPLDSGIGNMALNDEHAQHKNLNSSTRSKAVGSNNLHVSPGEAMMTTNQAASSESTEDTPYHLRRFRVVRKIPIRRSKSRANNSNL